MSLQKHTLKTRIIFWEYKRHSKINRFLRKRHHLLRILSFSSIFQLHSLHKKKQWETNITIIKLKTNVETSIRTRKAKQRENIEKHIELNWKTVKEKPTDGKTLFIFILSKSSRKSWKMISNPETENNP